MDLDVRMKATLIGAMFLIDFMFFEKKGNEEQDGIGMFWEIRSGWNAVSLLGGLSPSSMFRSAPLIFSLAIYVDVLVLDGTFNLTPAPYIYLSKKRYLMLLDK